MFHVNVWLFLLLVGGMCRFGQATCVLESEYGFVINCAFKKSGLFRVRNLGGVKAHIGLGISFGDELGFKQSYANTEINRRRSASASPFIAQAALAQAQKSTSNGSRMSNQNALPYIQSAPIVQKTKQIQASTVPPFKPIPPAPERPIVPLMTSMNLTRFTKPKKDVQSIPPATSGIATYNQMQSISRISQGPTIITDEKQGASPQIAIIMPVKQGEKGDGNIALQVGDQSNFPAPLQQTSSNYIQNLLINSNISEADLEEVILRREKQEISTTTSTTTQKPKYYKHSTVGKVMNAPKEYYPVGYDKNFDDNFSSRVDLPETSFRCGDQKHFPGLYADEDLGCMVFHVCALTDDGLIMKSFLCPESTLFDQTILKCNWWFYVDCKSSKKLYDSNIPISKSYQLMKALTFFSSYKKESQSNNNNSQQITKSTVTKD